MIMCIQNGALLYVCMYVYVCHVHVWCTIHTCAVIICMHIQNLKSTGTVYCEHSPISMAFFLERSL